MQLCKSYVVVKRRDWWTGHQWIPQTQFRWETDSSVNRPFTTAITINGDRIIKRRAPWKRDEERGGWPKNTHKIIKMSTPPNVLAIPSMITIVIDVWSVSIHHHDQTRGLFLLWGCPLWNRWMGVNLYAYLIGPDQIPFVETQTPIDLFFKWTVFPNVNPWVFSSLALSSFHGMSVFELEHSIVWNMTILFSIFWKIIAMKIQEFRKKSVETSKNKGNFENANLQRK